MLNPNNQTTSGNNPSINNQNPLNNTPVQNFQGLNTFDLSHENYLTSRFGEITPFFYTTAFEKDRLFLKVDRDIRAYTNKAPNMNPLRCNLAYFSVPFRCIMPNTWQYIYVNPSKGQDVEDNVLPGFNFPLFIKQLALRSSSRSIKLVDMEYRYFYLLYLTCSRGSLLNYLGIAPRGIDVVDTTYSKLLELFYDDSLFPSNASVDITYDGGVTHNFSRRLGRSKMRYQFEYFFTHRANSVEFKNGAKEDAFISSSTDILISCFLELGKMNPLSVLNNSSANDYNYNLFKVIAYQMVCSHYFSNDKIDNIYTSDLWLQNMASLSNASDFRFSYNGVSIGYDVFSRKVLDETFNNLLNKTGAVGGDDVMKAYFFFVNLFSYRNSLKYGDYFTGAKLKPLAVGDVSIYTGNNYINAIDVTKSLVKQRFLYKVQRAGSFLYDYVRELFGVELQKQNPMPNFLSKESFYLHSEVNTDQSGDDLGKEISKYKEVSSNFGFDIFIDEPSVVLGLSYFDYKTVYANYVERDNFHKNRFDFFNPMLQGVGDQIVYTAELGNDMHLLESFGYQSRYAEFKYKNSHAHGGFIKNLPGYLLLSEILDTHLSGDLIRYQPKDIDGLYSSLNGVNMADYFHFICKFNNNFIANRAMDFYGFLEV